MKTIKLTAEQAQQLYAKDPTFRDTILHEFTDEELGCIEPKPFTWYDLVEVKGMYIGQMSYIRSVNSYCNPASRNVYPCSQDAEQALAKCMVLQLARHYNGCEQHEIGLQTECFNAYYDWDSKKICVAKSAMKKFNLVGVVNMLRKSDLEKCIKDNEDLFKIMLGVNL